jgi:hypothetical protein
MENQIQELLKKENFSAKEFAEFVFKIIIDNYGEHNYEDFKKVINDKLKS